MNDRLLTVRELAEYLRVNPFSVYRWIAKNRVPHLRVNRSIRFRLEDVERSMRERAQREPKG